MTNKRSPKGGGGVRLRYLIKECFRWACLLAEVVVPEGWVPFYLGVLVIVDCIVLWCYRQFVYSEGLLWFFSVPIRLFVLGFFFWGLEVVVGRLLLQRSLRFIRMSFFLLGGGAFVIVALPVGVCLALWFCELAVAGLNCYH